MATKEFPVGKAQQTVLDALNLKADNARAADELFEELGIEVRPVRQGRTSIPQVRVFNRVGGGFIDGEGQEEAPINRTIDLSPLAPWIVK